MSYRLLIKRRAQKELSQLSDEVYERARDAILRLGQDPRPRNARKLAGRTGWRYRVGNYRVIYEIDDQKRTITVLHVGHRRDVYR